MIEIPEPGQSVTIKQLERLTGLSRRTIHYYTAERLLPPPEGHARTARYSREHVLRLQLVQILRDTTQLRLDGIREMLAPLTMEELEDYQQRLAKAPLGKTSPYSTREIVKILERA